MQPGYFGDAGGPMPGFHAAMGQQHTNQTCSPRGPQAGTHQTANAWSNAAPIPAALGDVFAGLEQLQIIVVALEDRLVPVLREQMTASGSAVDLKQDVAACPLSDSLSTAAQQLDRLIRRVDSIRDRLCI